MLHKFNQLFKSYRAQNAVDSGAFGSTGDSHNKEASSGRSMVEMLGVLAIIGVLSVGALAGFNYAMDKNRANETLNDVHLRAVDLIIQSSRGNALSLAEWETKGRAGYIINNPAVDIDGNIILTAYGLPERVCKMVVDGSGDYIVQLDIEGTRINSSDDCGTDNNITFHFDAGATLNTNGGMGGDSGVPDRPELCENVDCGECATCKNGTCEPKLDGTACGTNKECFAGLCVANDIVFSGFQCSDDSDCATAGECWVCDGYTNTCDPYSKGGQPCANGAGTCNSGQCLLNDNACSAAGQNTCDDGYYCADTDGSCYAFNYSKCTKANWKKITVNGKTVYVSTGSVNWWNADSMCQSIGKQLVSVDRFFDGWNGGNQWGWDGLTLTAFGEAVKNALGGGGCFWTSSAYEDNCYMYYVDLGNNSVHDGSRSYGTYSAAFCE